MALEMSHLKASHSVANARTKVIGLLSRVSCPSAQSALQVQLPDGQAIQKQQEAEAG